MGISPLPRPVRYKERGVVYTGNVIDEVQLLEETEDMDYLDLIQLIRWDDGHYGIRFCYYIKPHGTSDDEWLFANRPLSLSKKALSDLFKKAKVKRWFKKILEESAQS
jgi:hypothetical protein